MKQDVVIYDKQHELQMSHSKNPLGIMFICLKVNVLVLCLISTLLKRNFTLRKLQIQYIFPKYRILVLRKVFRQNRMAHLLKMYLQFPNRKVSFFF